MAISEYLKNLREKVGGELLLLPSVAAIIRDEHSRILLQKTGENVWSLPAGAIEPGETAARAILREVREETGLIVCPLRIVGVFGGGDFRYTYSNGNAVEYTIVLFECEQIGGELGGRDDETVELKFFALDEMPSLPIKYPREIFTQTFENAQFEWSEKWLEELEQK